ncbi:MAG: alpha/beta fold hydrolase [Actinomycetota bacterium]|nr:alpha/beta fold hydrolase [Actinomycetota bacterium]
MSKTLSYFFADDGVKISYFKWIPDKEIKGIVLIAHGMAEHSERYDDFAGFLNRNAFAVFANDHRGHGKTAGSTDRLGFISEENGWEIMVNDFLKMKEEVKSQYPAKPLFALGHSMGTFIIRDIMLEDKKAVSTDLEGVILSGTGCGLGLMGKIGKLIFKSEIGKKGADGKSQLLHDMSFGKYNKSFRPNRTEYDWLSTNNDNVDRYIEDPCCGTVFSASFFRDLAYGIEKVNNFKNIKNVNKNLPIFLISGKEDPVGNFSKGVKKVYSDYIKAGIPDIQMNFYEGLRHEILNETGKEKVYKDILNWLIKYIP